MSNRMFRSTITSSVLLMFAASGVCDERSSGTATALVDYVRQPDATYAWKLVKKVEGDLATTFVVQLTSQKWRTTDDVDRPVWEHWLLVVKPAKPVSNKAFLLIGGGSNDRGAPEKPDAVTMHVAEATNSVVAELRMVPNQPLTFHGDGVPRKEDDLIAYAWDQYLRTGDATWLPRLPMVKSAARAMDCIQELLAGNDGGEHRIEKFVVAGGSKRGWTTWMTGVADPRVEALVPIVIDVLNVEPSMRHHAEVYGFWAQAIGNYVQHNITTQWGHPRMEEIYEIVDPYHHRDRLTMPKFIVNACGDQFFCPDSSQFYFDDLKGEKHLRYVPNADHSLRNSDAIESITAFYQMVQAGKARPRFTWKFQRDGSIRVAVEDQPKKVLLWQATNPKARDFRLKTIGSAFTSSELADEGDGVFVGRVGMPDQGWTAFLVESTFDTGTSLPLKLTTAVRVLPKTLPHEGIDVSKTPYEPNVTGLR
jgi:PhoPQ-activated pathogenicity-related protein